MVAVERLVVTVERLVVTVERLVATVERLVVTVERLAGQSPRPLSYPPKGYLRGLSDGTALAVMLR